MGCLARKDAPVAITATARELACLIYTNGHPTVTEYVGARDSPVPIESAPRQPDRLQPRPGRAKQLGYQLVKVVEDAGVTNPVSRSQWT